MPADSSREEDNTTLYVWIYEGLNLFLLPCYWPTACRLGEFTDKQFDRDLRQLVARHQDIHTRNTVRTCILY